MTTDARTKQPTLSDAALRRRALIAGLGGATLASACGTSVENDEGTSGAGAGSGNATSGNGAGGTSGSATGGAGGGEPMPCTETADNILGPYYRADAPFRNDLTEADTLGTRITVSGRVLTPTCTPIADALVDVWQANADGDYDNDGVDDPPVEVFVLRGRINTDADGNYSFHTIIPGHYLNGNQYRPAHIHVTVSAPGFESLTTQLYFEGDPYNDIDPFIVASLIMPLTDEPGGEKSATFDFVIAPV
jgi:protocatechuate 3,4-dioxygenase beta subunit